MSNEPSITCPNCKTEIKLSESLAAPLIESAKRQYEARLAEKESEVAKREEQIRGVIEATAGMYGDLQGIAGKTLKEIEGLDLILVGDGTGHE